MGSHACHFYQRLLPTAACWHARCCWCSPSSSSDRMPYAGRHAAAHALISVEPRGRRAVRYHHRAPTLTNHLSTYYPHRLPPPCSVEPGTTWTLGRDCFAIRCYLLAYHAQRACSDYTPLRAPDGTPHTPTLLAALPRAAAALLRNAARTPRAAFMLLPLRALITSWRHRVARSWSCARCSIRVMYSNWRTWAKNGTRVGRVLLPCLLTIWRCDRRKTFKHASLLYTRTTHLLARTTPRVRTAAHRATTTPVWPHAHDILIPCGCY